MASLKEFQSLWTELDPELKRYLSEAKELRTAVSEPDQSDGLAEVHDRLINARRSQDRLEVLLANTSQFRARLRKLVQELNDAYEDKWRDAVSEVRTGEFMSGKAQDAMYQTKALQQLVDLRRAKSMLADVEEVYDVLNLHYYGLNNVRKDNDAFIRAISLQSQLER